MRKRKKTLFLDLQDHYSLNEAKREIDGILAKYDSKCKIEFHKTMAEITDSYKVSSLNDRHRICSIIARTGLTGRSYEDLSAEWVFHNIAWFLHFKRSHAKDVALDYKGDPRRSVRIVTHIFDMFNIE